MNKFLLITLCFICLHNDEPVLSWNDAYQLKWSDFKAKPNNKSGAVAVTASGITFGYTIRETDANKVVSFNAEVEALFYPEKSWYKPNLADVHVLGHEQLHFDITELHARKFREQLKKLEISQHIKKALNSLNKSVNKALADMQNQYDNETNYSRDNEAQAQWRAFVTEELKKLSQYKTVD